jgi:tetratricopeptide (TPR) repeat protein
LLHLFNPFDFVNRVDGLPAAALLVLSAALLSPQVWAHDSPEKLINRYTALISEHGPTPLLLYRRATEYRVLGELSKAARDLEQAIKLQPNFVTGQTELSRIYLAQGRATEALTAVNRAIDLVPGEQERSEHYMIRADAYRATGDCEKALADCERAFRYEVNDLDWFITRSQLQARLGQLEAAAAGLRQGFEKTGSAVLEMQWIEALIDAGRFREALENIEPQLHEARWQSSWLLRRARARIGLQETDTAREDLKKAIAEINQRVSTEYPDLTLLADRGLAHALLGNRAAAERDLRTVRELGAEGWLLFRLESTLARDFPSAPLAIQPP